VTWGPPSANVSFSCLDIINGSSGEIYMFLCEVKTAGSAKGRRRAVLPFNTQPTASRPKLMPLNLFIN
jgi:hypothetical protein